MGSVGVGTDSTVGVGTDSTVGVGIGSGSTVGIGMGSGSTVVLANISVGGGGGVKRIDSPTGKALIMGSGMP
tara:strand:- start:15 stop:230 length:216 start_codon:yes stop_codon:yes gene_type:complete